MIYDLPTSLTIGDTEYPIRSDFRAVLDIIAALNDPDLTDKEKSFVTLFILYEDYTLIDDLEAALEKAMWFISCGEQETKSTRRLMDWEQDFPLIVAPVNRVLGYECRACEYLHWWTFISAYYEIGECAFSTVVSIRDKKQRGKKLESWEKDFYRNNRSSVDFRKKLSQAEQDEIDDIVG